MIKLRPGKDKIEYPGLIKGYFCYLKNGSNNSILNWVLKLNLVQ